MPRNLKEIASNAFEAQRAKDLAFVVTKGSYAQKYAKAHKIAIVK